MFKEPDSVNSLKNRIYDEGGDITYNQVVNTGEMYQLPTKVNSAINRGTKGELSGTTWPPIQNPDPWNLGIDEVAVNSDNPIVTRDARLESTIHEMWEM